MTTQQKQELLNHAKRSNCTVKELHEVLEVIAARINTRTDDFMTAAQAEERREMQATIDELRREKFDLEHQLRQAADRERLYAETSVSADDFEIFKNRANAADEVGLKTARRQRDQYLGERNYAIAVNNELFEIIRQFAARIEVRDKETSDTFTRIVQEFKRVHTSNIITPALLMIQEDCQLENKRATSHREIAKKHLDSAMVPYGAGYSKAIPMSEIAKYLDWQETRAEASGSREATSTVINQLLAHVNTAESVCEEILRCLRDGTLTLEIVERLSMAWIKDHIHERIGKHETLYEALVHAYNIKYRYGNRGLAEYLKEGGRGLSESNLRWCKEYYNRFMEAIQAPNDDYRGYHEKVIDLLE
jgi:hypothetical protein